MNWSTSLQGPIHSSPAIRSDGTIVIGSDAGKVFAIRPSDGSILWSSNVSNLVWLSPAIGNDGTVYVGAHTNRLHALDGSDGTELWSYDTFLSDITSSPVVGNDGTIYFGSHDGNLYALNPDGTKKWEFSTGGAIRSSVAIDNAGVLYFGSDSGAIFALNPDGTQKWSRSVANAVRSTPAFYENVVYVGSNANRLHVLDASDGTILWEKDFLLSDVRSSPSIGPDGTIYIGTDDDKVYALDQNGNELWSFSTGGDVESSPIVDRQGRIFVGSDDGYIYGIKPNGTLLWKYQTLGDVKSSPAIGPDGAIVVGSLDSKLYSVGFSDTIADADCDGIPDDKENLYGLDPQDPTDSDTDPDGDGVSTADEIFLGGNPLSQDTDGDGIPDDPDLFDNTDFDGDGIVLSSDNCDYVTNPSGVPLFCGHRGKCVLCHHKWCGVSGSEW